MASYEDAAATITTITEAAEAGGISQATADAITSIVQQVDADPTVEVVVATDVSTITADNAAEVAASTVVLQAADASANVTFTEDTAVQAMVVGGGGNSNVVFETTKAVTVQLQGGVNDSVSTGSGDDTITFAGGEATIATGDGHDTVVLQGGEAGGTVYIDGKGSGDTSGEVVNKLDVKLEFDLSTTQVQATIDAGDSSFDTIQLTAKPTWAQDKADFRVKDAHKIDFDPTSGTFTMKAKDADGNTVEDGGSVTMTNVNIVQFGDTTQLEDIAILATTKEQATIAKLYEVALGRQAIDKAGDGSFDESNSDANTILDGINNWYNLINQGANAEELYKGFVNCEEFNNKYGDNSGMSADQFVNEMFKNADVTGGTVLGKDAAAWKAEIENGTISRQDAAMQISTADEVVTSTGLQGETYIIDGWSHGA